MDCEPSWRECALHMTQKTNKSKSNEQILIGLGGLATVLRDIARSEAVIGDDEQDIAWVAMRIDKLVGELLLRNDAIKQGRRMPNKTNKGHRDQSRKRKRWG